MRAALQWLPLTLGYAVCMAASHLILKILGQHSLGKGIFLFALANGIGFLGMVLLPFALTKGPAPLIYALAIGGGFTLLQIGCWFLFPRTISLVELTGIFLIVAGLSLLASRQLTA